MNGRSMDVFALRDAVVGEYRKFATSFTTIHAPDIRRQVQDIYAEGRFWPEPLIQVNPAYLEGKNVEQLSSQGTLEPRTAEIFRIDGKPIQLHKHQEEAIALASQGESFVVTSGTGSGKSLCFFIPIVDALLAEKRERRTPRTRAIVVYPMNALANSQLDWLRTFVEQAPGEKPVTFARYTSQEDDPERLRISESPPDILLTNFMMLELLMTRQEDLDRKVIGNCTGLRFLVLDELHTYRGRQGADVALLVRRVRERLSPERLQCIGTSATMASEGSFQDRNRVVAEVASKLFSVPVPESSVVVERLRRVTDQIPEASVRSALGSAIDAGIQPALSDAELRAHPLAIWVETHLGVEFNHEDQRWVRARPLTLKEAATRLAEDAGRSEPLCRAALRDFLLVSSLPEGDRTGAPGASARSFFAFKLHQFISGAGHAYATLEAPGERSVTVEGQQFLPGAEGKRLYPVHFCRDCGHEYHPVRLVDDGASRGFRARNIDDAPPTRSGGEVEGPAGDGDEAVEGEVFGFLTLHPPADEEFKFADRLELDYPEAWLEPDPAGQPRLKPLYRRARAREVLVAPDGKIGSGAKAWFLPGKFRFCLRCGATQGGATRDRNRLASLSAEGRSSATTVLVGSALRWMHEAHSGLAADAYTRKLLGFTDNRQDAALQAGHFNDFLFVSLVRGAFLGALEAAGDKGLRSEELGAAQQRALGFNRPNPEIRAEWLADPDLGGFHLQEAERTLRQVLAYRVWFDQRRGWRYTNPNLEQLGLVEVEYVGLDELAANDKLFSGAPAVLRDTSPATRAEAYRVLLDHLRKAMAIRSEVLEPMTIEQMTARSHSRLRAPWGLTYEEKPRRGRWLMISPPPRREMALRDEDLVVRGGWRSALGRLLRASKSPRGRKIWDDAAAVRALKPKEMDGLIEAMLQGASAYVSKEATPFGNQPGWRLNDACILFKKGTPEIDPEHPNESAFFRDYYANLSRQLRTPDHPLFGFEAREHTAQVDGDRRAVREKRFRYGEKERKALAEEAVRLRDMGEANRFLPVLFCSPTMELGIDISDLGAVYLRNVPPTPANYAQRSGRGGRAGQAALVLTYCSALGPHDQYFFARPKEMVHGEVRPPSIDLANRDLIESHLWAVWLACTGVPLSPAISKLLVLSHPGRPLAPELKSAMSAPGVAEEAVRRTRRVLDLLEGELDRDLAPWFQDRDQLAVEVVGKALRRFEEAFARWRQLFLAAERQRDAARRTMDDYSAPQKEKRAAHDRHAQAIQQIELLQKGTSSLSSDFYTYRYLATEGFLPGYNFPRLPLMAYIPAPNDRPGRYLQRPRFLALAEFGPRSLVYHEGRAYRVVRALLAPGHHGGAAADTRLPTETVRICKLCGGGHFNDHDSMCHACGAPLGDAEHVKDVFRIENVSTKPAERITANDEERQRQGFELQTTFEWAVRDGVLDIRPGVAGDGAGTILDLTFGAGATITRLNKGLRRRAIRSQLGFNIDPVSGFWEPGGDEEEESQDPTAVPHQRIVPSVRDFKNALLVRPPRGAGLSQSGLATLQHALLRGIEAVFQLEEGEILAEPMPRRDERSGFLFYEAAEGGAGVLTRIVAEPRRLAEVARQALSIMHFNLESEGLPEDAGQLADRPGTSCVAACYRCLLSYYNQPDHELIHRRDPGTREVLVRLARATTSVTAGPGRDAGAILNGMSARFGELARGRGLPAPDPDPYVAGEARIPLVWRDHYVAALLDAAPRALVRQLEDKGFEVIVFGEDAAAWASPFDRLARALGRAP